MGKKKGKRAPIIRLRSLLTGVGLMALLITGPILMVWKQVYITSRSMEIEQLADSLVDLSKTQTELRLRCERLKSKDRIEKIAHSSLGLEYPMSSHIVVVKIPDQEKRLAIHWPQELAAFIKRSLFGENG